MTLHRKTTLKVLTRAGPLTRCVNRAICHGYAHINDEAKGDTVGFLLTVLTWLDTVKILFSACQVLLDYYIQRRFLTYRVLFFFSPVRSHSQWTEQLWERTLLKTGMGNGGMRNERFLTSLKGRFNNFLTPFFFERKKNVKTF